MNAKIKARWVAALRSGKYKQGRGGLREGDTYCCLGVLCELAAREGVVTRDWGVSGDVRGYGGALVLPPPEIVNWAELRSKRWWKRARSDCRVLWEITSLLNDHGRTFTEIADIIEKYL